MLRRLDVKLMSNPVCSKSVDNLISDDFRYYDKDGFELNDAEHQFYRAMGYPVDYGILNHNCWQEPWFELERDNLGLVLDHAMFLCRCSYTGAAEEQLQEYKKRISQADYLLQTKQKWGFDFALDAVRDGHIFEVIHVEYDSNDYHNFTNRFINFEYLIRHTDWIDCADRIWAQRDQWQSLKGFDQNHWKANYLIGWDRAEYTEKSV